MEKENGIKKTSDEIKQNDATRLLDQGPKQDDVNVSSEVTETSNVPKMVRDVGNKGDAKKSAEVAGKESHIPRPFLLSILESDLSCPMCLTVPRMTPIPCCPKGHILCLPCHTSLREQRHKQDQTCPTCRTPLEDNTSALAEALIHRVVHRCQFAFEGCEERFLLDNISQHEEECGAHKIICVHCNTSISVGQFRNHNDDCISADVIEGNTVEISYWIDHDGSGCEKWDGKRPIIYKKEKTSWSRHVLNWEDNEFFLAVTHLRSEKKWLFYAAMNGNLEKRGKYKVEVFLRNKDDQLQLVTISDVVPLYNIFEEEKIQESGLHGTLTDQIMQKFLKQKPDGIRFKANFKIEKW